MLRFCSTAASYCGLISIISEDSDYRQFFEPLSSAVKVFQHFRHAARVVARAIRLFFFAVVGRARLELATNGLKVRCSTD